MPSSVSRWRWPDIDFGGLQQALESGWQGVSLVSILFESFLPLLPRLSLLVVCPGFAFIFLSPRLFHVLTLRHSSAESALGHRVLSSDSLAPSSPVLLATAPGTLDLIPVLLVFVLLFSPRPSSFKFPLPLHFISLFVANLLSLGSYHEGSFTFTV